MFITSWNVFNLEFYSCGSNFQEFSERYYCYYRAVNGTSEPHLTNLTDSFDDISIADDIILDSAVGVTGFDVWLGMIPCISVAVLMALRLWRPESAMIYWITLTYIYFAFVGTEIMYTLNVGIAMKRSPNETNPLQILNSIVIILRQFVLTPLGGFTFKHTLSIFRTHYWANWPYHCSTYWLQVSFFAQLIIAISTMMACWYLELRTRKEYEKTFRQRDSNRNQRTLDHMAKVLSIVAKQEAQSNAAHEVSGCFNTLLTAALEMQTYIQNKEFERNGGAEELSNTTSTGSSGKQPIEEEKQVRWQHFFEMITEAQDDFSFLQNTRTNQAPLETNQFHVSVMLENAARVFKYGARNGMVIHVNTPGDRRLCLSLVLLICDKFAAVHANSGCQRCFN